MNRTSHEDHNMIDLPWNEGGKDPQFGPTRSFVHGSYEILWQMRLSPREDSLSATRAPLEGRSIHASPPKKPEHLESVDSEDYQIVVAPTHGSEKEEYNPLDKPHLFSAFARIIDEPLVGTPEHPHGLVPSIKDEDLLGWVHRYGLPVVESTYLQSNKTLINTPFVYDPLHELHWEIVLARQLLSLYEDCITRDDERLRDRITTFSNLNIIQIDNRSTATFAPMPIEQWRRVHYIHFAHRYILKTCMKHFLPVRPTVIEGTLYDPLERPDLPFATDIETGWRSETLLSSMYLSFWWLVTNNTPMKKCKHCGRLFFVTRADQAYCPHPYGGQSLCRKSAWYHRNKSRASNPGSTHQ